MTLRLNGSTSGYTEIDAPAVAGSNALVLPTGNGTADQVIAGNGSGALSWVDRGRMVLETAKPATGTAIDFIGIPSWVKKITVVFSGVSTNGTSITQIQLGTSSGLATTGYAGTGSSCGNAGSYTVAAASSGFYTDGAGAANYTRNGLAIITSLGGNVWAYSGTFGVSTVVLASFGGGAVTLSGTLDRIRITTVNGTDTFDSGSVNILYEG